MRSQSGRRKIEEGETIEQSNMRELDRGVGENWLIEGKIETKTPSEKDDEM